MRATEASFVGNSLKFVWNICKVSSSIRALPANASRSLDIVHFCLNLVVGWPNGLWGTTVAFFLWIWHLLRKIVVWFIEQKGVEWLLLLLPKSFGSFCCQAAVLFCKQHSVMRPLQRRLAARWLTCGWATCGWSRPALTFRWLPSRLISLRCLSFACAIGVNDCVLPCFRKEVNAHLYFFSPPQIWVVNLIKRNRFFL